MPVRNAKPVIIVLDRKHDQALDRLAEQSGKSRSAVIRDAIDRMTLPVPDAETASGIYQQK